MSKREPSILNFRKHQTGKRMLTDTADAVAAIAVARGFSDQAHFARAFAQMHGLSLTQFR